MVSIFSSDSRQESECTFFPKMSNYAFNTSKSTIDDSLLSVLCVYMSSVFLLFEFTTGRGGEKQKLLNASQFHRIGVCSSKTYDLCFTV